MYLFHLEGCFKMITPDYSSSMLWDLACQSESMLDCAMFLRMHA